MDDVSTISEHLDVWMFVYHVCPLSGRDLKRQLRYKLDYCWILFFKQKLDGKYLTILENNLCYICENLCPTNKSNINGHFAYIFRYIKYNIMVFKCDISCVFKQTYWLVAKNRRLNIKLNDRGCKQTYTTDVRRKK